MCNPTENQVIQKAQKGDVQAFSLLVINHQDFLYNLALRVTSHPQEAQDLSQEAFIRAWRALSSFRGQSSFRTWLYRILVNLSYDRYPKLKQEMQNLSIEAEEFDPPDEYILEENLEFKNLRAFLHEKMKSLPETYRMVLMMRYQNDLSYKEIATILDIPMGSVKTIIFRAKAALKEQLVLHQEVAAWIE